MKQPTRNPRDPFFGDLHDAERDEQADDRRPLEFTSKETIDLLPLGEQDEQADVAAARPQRASAPSEPLPTETRSEPAASDPIAPDSPWAVLRRHRQRRGMTVEDVARDTRLKAETIHRLERDDTVGIPGTYLKGYLRAYAKAVDVPVESLPVQLRGLREPDLIPDLAAANRRAQGKAGAQDRPAIRLLLPLALVGVLGAGAWWWLGGGEEAQRDAVLDPLASLWQGDDTPRSQAAPAERSATDASASEAPAAPTPSESAATPDEVVTETASTTRESASSGSVALSGTADDAASSSAESSGTVAPADPPTEPPAASAANATTASGSATADEPAAAVDDGRARLRLRVTEPAWVEVRSADRDRVVSEVLQPGTDRTVTADYPVRVVIGFAPGVTLEWNGEAVDLAPHSRGDRTARFTLQAP